MSVEDYYATLELDSSASQSEVKKQYRRKALEWHPDKNPDRREEAEAMFKRISEAYEVLGDPQRRADYDRMRRGGPHVSSFDGLGGFHDPFEMFDAFFSDAYGHRDPFGGMFGAFDGDPFQPLMGRPRGGTRSRTRGSSMGSMGGSLLDDFFGGSDPFGMMGPGMSQGTAFSQSWSQAGGSNVQSRSVSSRTFIDANGRRVTRTETTIVHPDGRRETTANETVDESAMNCLGNDQQNRIGYHY